jgi:predicted P-loop ATPase
MRTTSFVASVNETSFLKDPTGSTRFFVLPVKDINGMHGLDMLQLYKEILETTDIYNFDMTKEEREIQAVGNKEFEMPDIIEEVFLDNFDVIAEKDEGDYFSAVQILEQMGYGKKDITHNRRIDIGRVLNKYKCYQNTHLRKWKLKIKQDNRRVE